MRYAVTASAEPHPSLDSLPDLLTLAQMASFLQISKGTLYHWRADNISPTSIRMSGHVRYRKNELIKWLDTIASTSG